MKQPDTGQTEGKSCRLNEGDIHVEKKIWIKPVLENLDGTTGVMNALGAGSDAGLSPFEATVS